MNEEAGNAERAKGREGRGSWSAGAAAAFFAIAVAIGSLAYLPIILHSYGLIAVDLGLLAYLYGLSPFIAAMLAARKVKGKVGPDLLFSQLSVKRAGSLAWNLLVPVGIAAALITTAAAATVASGGPFEAEKLVLYELVPLFLVNYLYNVWEEIAWRGFAQPYLQERLSPVASALVVSVGWAAWHWPLYAVKDSEMLANVPHFSLVFVGFALESLVYASLYNSTRGSVFACTSLHAATNAFGMALLSNTGASRAAFWWYLAARAALAGALLAARQRTNLSRSKAVTLADVERFYSESERLKQERKDKMRIDGTRGKNARAPSDE
ncbi:MAG: hypothetical protein Kow0069_22400 [Promethearchaeota archaeon]